MTTLLSKGLGFTPTPRPPPMEKLEEDFENFANSIRTKYHFRNKPSKERHPFKTKSWIPPQTNQTLEKYITLTKQTLLNTPHEPTKKEISHLKNKKLSRN